MVILAPEERAQLIAATQGVASAFIEDMPHIRQVLNRTDPDKGEIRRLSNVLRRLLIDKGGDLRDIAAPRIGKFTLLSPDIGPFYKSARKEPFVYFQSGNVSVFGISFAAILFEPGSQARKVDGYNPDATVALPMDNFLSQKVICLKGDWVTRRDVIKYVANVASGVHSGKPKEKEHHLLNRIRHVATLKMVTPPAGPPMPGFGLNLQALSDAELPFSYDKNNIDPVLVELLAAADYLAKSPDLLKLETVVTEELRA